MLAPMPQAARGAAPRTARRGSAQHRPLRAAPSAAAEDTQGGAVVAIPQTKDQAVGAPVVSVWGANANAWVHGFSPACLHKHSLHPR